jgi:plastocyanin
MAREVDTTRIIRVGAAMAAVATFAIAGCGSDKKSSSTTAASATTVAAGAATTAAGRAAAGAISIQAFKYTIPSGLKAGATVTITNADGPAHTFTDKDGKFDVHVDGSGGTGTLTLPAAGTYSIICKIHSNMSGTLTVS